MSKSHTLHKSLLISGPAQRLPLLSITTPEATCGFKERGIAAQACTLQISAPDHLDPVLAKLFAIVSGLPLFPSRCGTTISPSIGSRLASGHSQLQVWLCRTQTRRWQCLRAQTSFSTFRTPMQHRDGRCMCHFPGVAVLPPLLQSAWNI